MSDFRYDARRDCNEVEIVRALQMTGHEVYRVKGAPFDLLVGRRAWMVVEVKAAKGRLTDAQEVFFNGGGTAPRVVVRSVDEALEAAAKHC